MMKKILVFCVLLGGCSGVRALTEAEYNQNGGGVPKPDTGISIDLVAVDGNSFSSASPPIRLDFTANRAFQWGVNPYTFVGPREGGNGRQYVYSQVVGGVLQYYGIILHSPEEIGFSLNAQNSARTVVWESDNPDDIPTLTKL